MSKGFYLAKLDLALLQMPGQAEKGVWRKVSQDLREFLLYFHDEIMMRMQPGRELVQDLGTLIILSTLYSCLTLTLS